MVSGVGEAGGCGRRGRWRPELIGERAGGFGMGQVSRAARDSDGRWRFAARDGGGRRHGKSSGAGEVAAGAGGRCSVRGKPGEGSRGQWQGSGAGVVIGALWTRSVHAHSAFEEMPVASSLIQTSYHLTE